jgi:hypothetical protein
MAGIDCGVDHADADAAAAGFGIGACGDPTDHLARQALLGGAAGPFIGPVIMVEIDRCLRRRIGDLAAGLLQREPRRYSQAMDGLAGRAERCLIQDFIAFSHEARDIAAGQAARHEFRSRETGHGRARRPSRLRTNRPPRSLENAFAWLPSTRSAVTRSARCRRSAIVIAPVIVPAVIVIIGQGCGHEGAAAWRCGHGQDNDHERAQRGTESCHPFKQVVHHAAPPGFSCFRGLAITMRCG